MAAPKSDEAGIRQVIRALRAAGYTLVEVFDGEDNVPVKNETEAVEAITAVDDAHLFVRTPDGEYNPWVRFVMGNEPEEVVCDYVLTLSHVLDPLTERWIED
jgi:hypothetical protein